VSDGEISFEKGEDDLVIENRSNRPATVSLERCAWPPEALPVADVVAHPDFLALAPHEMLAEGDSAPCGHGAVVAASVPGGMTDQVIADLTAIGTVFAIEQDAVLIACADAEAAHRIASDILTAMPDAAIGIDCGPLTLTTAGGVSVFAGAVPDAALALCMGGEFGDVQESEQAMASAGS